MVKLKTALNQTQLNAVNQTPYIDVESEKEQTTDAHTLKAKAVVIIDPLTGRALGSSDFFLTHQTPTITDNLAVQNTWYTIFSATNFNLIAHWLSVTVANETIEVRMIIDGITYTGADNFLAGENRYIIFQPIDGSLNLILSTNLTVNGNAGMYNLQGKSITIEARKTTALGASHIVSRVIWSKRV